MKNGVPYDVAWSWDESERLAAVVCFGGFEGNKFSWRDGRWLTREETD